jgi:ribosomal protein S18 acetylase RimI-like enzyme
VNDAPFVTGALSASHDRASFTCGVEPLDRYFRQQASQDMRRRIATCFVLTEAATGAIAGYYTLTATNVLVSQLPDALTAKLPRYAAIPAVLIGRLAVSASFQARKLGSALLADAVTRVARADIATFAIVVDPKDDAARRFYQHHGFLDLPPDRGMFIAMESTLRFFGAG